MAMQSALDPFTLLKEDTPAPPPAQIRPFAAATDIKVARYLIGASIMEPSSIANLYTLWSPVFVLVWAVCSHLLIMRIAGGYPTTIKTLLAGHGLVAAWESTIWSDALIQWLTVAPALVAPPVALLALFELRHRNKFEDEMTRAIGEEDMINIEGYYGVKALRDGAPASAAVGGRKGFWVLEYDQRIIGAIGLDGLKPLEPLTSIVDLLPPPGAPAATAGPNPAENAAASSTTATEDTKYSLRSRKAAADIASATASTAVKSSYTDTLFIRRFGTSLSFRPANIEDDLLNTAADFAFAAQTPSPEPPAARIVITLRPTVQRALAKRLKRLGYKELPAKSPNVVDMDAWKRTESVQKSAGMFAPVSRVLDSVWPLDLSWRTYALEKTTWEARKKA